MSHKLEHNGRFPERTSSEVVPKATSRVRSTAEKLRILAEYEAYPTGAPERGALLRREGLYTSAISKWRTQRDRYQTTIHAKVGHLTITVTPRHPSSTACPTQMPENYAESKRTGSARSRITARASSSTCQRSRMLWSTRTRACAATS